MPRKVITRKRITAATFFTRATKADVPDLVRLGHNLWPTEKINSLRSEFLEYIRSNKDCIFLAQSPKGRIVGFIHGSLRFEYVEGASSSPVGYIEGLYVESKYRRRGLAKALVQLFEYWAISQNCNTCGSDTEVTNTVSRRVHQALGYAVAGTVVHFTKRIQ